MRSHTEFACFILIQVRKKWLLMVFNLRVCGKIKEMVMSGGGKLGVIWEVCGRRPRVGGRLRESAAVVVG